MRSAAAICVWLATPTILTPWGASSRAAGAQSADDGADAYAAARARMVAEEIEAAGLKNPRVLAAMRTTPRHEFIPPAYRQYAYVDAALPIGDRQTISPPQVVAYMTERLDPQPTDRVLEIGTGSGYQAAILSPLVKEVYTIEIVEPLGRRAEKTLARLGCQNVRVRVGDGYQGWPEKAPFDKIIVTCSPERVPRPLVDQLCEGGRMIIPVGERYQQNLVLLTKRNGKLEQEALQATLFVPMTGAAEESRQVKPDPLRPAVRNGGFEKTVGDSREPAGWHYLRQAVCTTDEGNAPEGLRWLRFANDEPGRSSQALQGLAIDGRRISRLKATCRAAAERIAPGPGQEQLAGLSVSFYDSRRAVIGTAQLGPWTGSFSWREEQGEFRVPLAAREAIIRIGLNGATGRLDIDDLRFSVAHQAD